MTVDPDALSSRSTEDLVRSARVRAVFRHLPLMLGVTMVIALLIVVALARTVSPARVLTWFFAVVLLSLARLALWMRYRRTGSNSEHMSLWDSVSTGGALLSGCLWGALGPALVPSHEPYPVFVAFVIAGLCAGTVATNFAHRPTVIAFIVPAVLPLAGWFLLQGSRLYAVMAAMTAIFALALVFGVIRFGRSFDAGIRVQAVLARHKDELAQTNLRLIAEMEERSQAEAALRQAQKMEAIGNLTAGIAHDMNNLLMTIGGASELMQKRVAASPEQYGEIASLLAMVARANARGSRLTRHLLAFARKEILAPSVVDLNALLRDLTDFLEATLGKSCRVELHLQDALWPVHVDRNEFERAIVNLVINARDAMPAGGAVTLATANVMVPPAANPGTPAGECVLVSVSDTGVGMPPEVKARAFDPFFTTKPAGHGSGLGLSQVYGLVRHSGGMTGLESAEGVGTTVKLYLPRFASPAQPSHPPAPPPDAGQSATRTGPDRSAPATDRARHLVVLDDEPEVMQVVVTMLQGAGYSVCGFTRSQDALDRIAADPRVGVFITNFGLPGEAGDVVARRARASNPSLRVIFMTGYNDAPALEREAWRLRKPFTEAELLKMLQPA